MAMQPDIQYVSFYMDGTAAKKLERKTQPKAQAPKPRYRKAKRKVVALEPVALLGILVAVVMLVSMISGVTEYQQCLRQQQQMQQYIERLQQENLQLQETYEAGYDLENIREIALAVGMVPVESVENITIDVQVPQQEEREMSFWEAATTFLAGLFA